MSIQNIQDITLSDDDDFDEIPPSAKRAKPSPSFLPSSDDSNDRASPILSVSKRTKKPVQLSIHAFTEVNGIILAFKKPEF